MFRGLLKFDDHYEDLRKQILKMSESYLEYHIGIRNNIPNQIKIFAATHPDCEAVQSQAIQLYRVYIQFLCRMECYHEGGLLDCCDDCHGFGNPLWDHLESALISTVVSQANIARDEMASETQKEVPIWRSAWVNFSLVFGRMTREEQNGGLYNAQILVSHASAFLKLYWRTMLVTGKHLPPELRDMTVEEGRQLTTIRKFVKADFSWQILSGPVHCSTCSTSCTFQRAALANLIHLAKDTWEPMLFHVCGPERYTPSINGERHDASCQCPHPVVDMHNFSRTMSKADTDPDDIFDE